MRNKPANAVSDTPFAAGIVQKASIAVDQYRFAFWKEDGRYVGQCVELDTLGTGSSAEAALKEARELAMTAASVMLEQGKRLPLPASGQARTVQVNIRLSPAEKRAIEEAAAVNGFRGISDYLRVRGLALA